MKSIFQETLMSITFSIIFKRHFSISVFDDSKLKKIRLTGRGIIHIASPGYATTRVMYINASRAGKT